MGTLLIATPARAQAIRGRLEADLGEALRKLFTAILDAGGKTRGEFLSFINKLELFDVEGEIDRLVGNPWELSDSSLYKLSLAPQHITYPVYDQMVSQMTRLDDLRTRRVQHLTVDAVPLIAVNLDLLGTERRGKDVFDSMVRYLNAREIVDIGTFILAQQPLFPQTPAEWAATKRGIASRRGAVALVGLGLGALFEAGAFSNSGTVKRWGSKRLGWYGGVSRFGYHLRPKLRGGLTLSLNGLEVAAGVTEQVRPSTTDLQTALELAIRESYLNRYTDSAGWNSFVQLAFRRVLSASSGYRQEWHTGRIGVFMKRPNPFRHPHLVFRASAETESDFLSSLRFAVGLGLDNTHTGLSAVLQSSRTLVTRDELQAPELRTGIFLAGTLESPSEYFIDEMEVRGRRLREAWETFRVIERMEKQSMLRLGVRSLTGKGGAAMPLAERRAAESELARAHMAETLAAYLETRRRAYVLLQWSPDAAQLHGPVDEEVLRSATTDVFARYADVATLLENAVGPLAALRNEFTELQISHDHLVELGRLEEAEVVQREIDESNAKYREESTTLTETLRLFGHYRNCANRIAAVAPMIAPKGFNSPMSRRTEARLAALLAPEL